MVDRRQLTRSSVVGKVLRVAFFCSTRLQSERAGRSSRESCTVVGGLERLAIENGDLQPVGILVAVFGWDQVKLGRMLVRCTDAEVGLLVWRLSGEDETSERFGQSAVSDRGCDFDKARNTSL